MVSASSTPGQTARPPYTGGPVRPGQPRALGQMVWRPGGRHRRQRSAGTSRCDTVAEETPPTGFASSSDALPFWQLRVSSCESQVSETPCLRTGRKREKHTGHGFPASRSLARIQELLAAVVFSFSALHTREHDERLPHLVYHVILLLLRTELPGYHSRRKIVTSEEIQKGNRREPPVIKIGTPVTEM